MTLNEMAQDAHKNSVAHGFWDGLDAHCVPTKLALIHSEVSEALEAWRAGEYATSVYAEGKPEGFPSELADIMIRVGDLAANLHIDLDAEVAAKMAHNRSRPYKHGKAF